MSDAPEIIAREALAATRGGPSVAVATVIHGDERTPAGAKMLVRADATHVGGLGDTSRDEAVRAAAHAALTKRPREIVQTIYIARDG